MGCCASRSSTSSHSPYSSTEPNTTSSRAAINSAQTPSATALPRPSTTHTTSSSQHHTHRHHRPLTEHFNRPLRRHIWNCETRIWTRSELARERADFFDTRVSGRPEIWQAIRAALEEVRPNEGPSMIDGGGIGIGADEGLATAQIILDAAGVTLPTGDLANGAYDALGAFYSLPEWVVADPANVSNADDVDGKVGAVEEDETEEDVEALRRREEKGKNVVAEMDLIKVKARLSDRGGPDVVVSVGKADSVRLFARRVFEDSDLPPSKRIKIAYMGKILKENESLLSQGWKEGHVVNALVFG